MLNRTTEAAAILHVDPSRVRLLCKQGRIKTMRVGNTYAIADEELTRFAAIASMAAAHLGAAVVAPHVAAPADAVAYLLRDSEPRVLAVESRLEHRLQDLDHAVPRVVALDSAGGLLPALGEADAPAGFSFEARWRSVQADDLVAIMYTSGTTGVPKGVEWANRNALLTAANFGAQHLPDGICDVSYLPFAHVFDRCLHWRQ